MTKIIGFTRGLSSDIVAFAVIFVAVMSYGLYRGKESLVSLIISLYLGVAAYSSSAFLKSLLFFKGNNTQVFLSKALVFLVIVILINFVINKIIGVTFSMSKVRNWIEIAILSVVVVASTIVIAFNILSFSPIYSPSLLPVSLLASGLALFWTMVGSLVVIFFVAR